MVLGMFGIAYAGAVNACQAETEWWVTDITALWWSLGHNSAGTWLFPHADRLLAVFQHCLHVVRRASPVVV